MADLAYARPRFDGTVVSFTAADVAGDTVPVDDHGVLLVKNDDTVAHVVTVQVPGDTKYGLATPDPSGSVAAGTIEAFGPFGSDLRDPADGLVHVTYDAVTAVSRMALAT